MKKTVLLLFLLFFNGIFAQSIEPTQTNQKCDNNNDGFEFFNLNDITSEILSTQNAADFVVTHHETYSDALSGVNPMTSPYNNINPFTQTVYARVMNTVVSGVQIISYNLVVNPTPIAPVVTLTNCADANNPCWDLDSIMPQILQGQSGLAIAFYTSQNEAYMGVNAITNTSCYMSPTVPPAQAPVYYSITNTATGCFFVSVVELVTITCENPNCPTPTNLFASSVTQNTAVIGWYDSNTGPYEIAINGMTMGPNVTTNPYTLSGLTCGETYTVSVRSICSATESSNWVTTTFTTLPCPQSGQPQSFSGCVDNGQQACFNLTDNDVNILGSLNPADYVVSYHATQADANANVNPISSPYCVNAGTNAVYCRLTSIADATYSTNLFFLNVSEFTYSPVQIPTISQCDDNLDGMISFNLTSVEAQLNTTNSIAYYTNQTAAETEQNPITNPSAFIVNVQSNLVSIFVRETVVGGCDIMHIFQLQTFSNCNLASVCSLANSLCNSLGVPFSNTVGVPSSGSAACLGTTPNPTWFYLPISGAGVVSLQVSQVTSNGVPLDVDYIMYGPFTNPVTPCSNPGLLLNSVVSCSYSASATENPIIPNAQPGQYYLMMVTNFSNIQGLITITELSNTQGAIDCSGFRLNAFLDSNNNGVEDANEPKFPLGQFHYEMNTNGVVHNVTAPSGLYNIYETNAANSYDLSYTVDSAYASMYNVTTPSYSNVNVVVGAGMIMYDFPVTIAQAYNDVAVTIVPISSPRPGFTYLNKVVYTNLGNQTVSSGTVTFTKDTNVSIVSISQAGTTTTATGFTYNYSNLLPFEVREMNVSMQVPPVPTVNAGQYLTNSASIVPLTGDVVPENNSSSLTQLVINAYDPNDKVESHGGRILFSSFTSNDYFYYTVRFENTGNASAINVRLNDVLDSQLDETSVRMVAASHNYTMDRIDNNLTWKFNNIQLPVSVANTNIGKGYVTFKVKPKPGYAVGDIIPNTASIYFDFNPAIVTNTFNTEFVTTLAVDQFENGDFVFYPNPTNDFITISLKNTANSIASIVVYDVLGKTLMTQKLQNVSSQTIDLSSVNTGIYFIEVTTDANLKVVKKVIVN